MVENIQIINNVEKHKVTKKLSENLKKYSRTYLTGSQKTQVYNTIEETLVNSKLTKVYGDVYSDHQLVRIKVLCYLDEEDKSKFKELNKKLVDRFNCVSLQYLDHIHSIIVWL